MDNSLEKIFRYIDGDMTSSEVALFQDELASNPSLNKTYLTQLNIHKTLSQVPAVTAPAYLVDNVMSMITQKKLSTDKFNSFAGLRNIAIGAIASIILTIVLGLVFSNQTVTGYSMGTFGKYFDQVPNLLVLPEGFYAYSKYMCFLLIVPLLIILDRFYQNRNSKTYSISKN
jgi:hypothetical protein